MILSALAAKLNQRAKADFKGRHYEAALIGQAVSWYLRYPLSYRDLEALFLEHGLEVDHSTLNRWVLADALLIEKRLRQFRKPHCGSVRIGETYNRVRGEWRYLYRAIDEHGISIDVLLSARRDLDAVKRCFRRCWWISCRLRPTGSARRALASTHPLSSRAARWAFCPGRRSTTSGSICKGIESDHFRVKQLMLRLGGFRSFNTACRTIQSFEALL